LELLLPAADGLRRGVRTMAIAVAVREPLDHICKAFLTHPKDLLSEVSRSVSHSDDAGRHRLFAVRHIENIEPSFIAKPMSPFTFSLPDMNSICPDCLPDSMSSQSWPATWSVRLGLVAGPGFTVQVPSLMTACQVPPPSPLTSYWIVALVPAALSDRKRPLIASNVS